MAFPGFDLSGRVVLITGGNGGIGLGMATGLVQSGAQVCIWGTNADKNAIASETLSQYGPKVTTQVVDVADEQAVNAGFAQALVAHGRIDGCFANAGIGGRGTGFEDMTTQEWDRIIAVNQSGVFYCFRAAAKHMRERAEQGDAFGRLVGTASLAAISGQARGQHYAQTKGGMISMMKALAVEYARYNVTAHTILPGWIETEMTEGAFSNDKFVSNVSKRIPTRRWGAPEDFSAIAIYIMSCASSYHTAETFLIDGGYFAF
ncbi:MAG: SDR family oxidoreductase [Pseudomonadota bacterium]